MFGVKGDNGSLVLGFNLVGRGVLLAAGRVRLDSVDNFFILFLSFASLRNQLLSFDRHFLGSFSGLVDGLGNRLLELENLSGLLLLEDVLLALLLHFLLGLARRAKLRQSLLNCDVQIFFGDTFFRIFEFLKDIV